MGCGLTNVIWCTHITNFLAEPSFKATRWVIGELLKFYTANWQAFPSNTRSSTNTILLQQNMTLNCRVLVDKINSNIILLNKRNKKEKRRKKNNSGKNRSEKVFLYLGGEISVSRTRSPFNVWLCRKVRI